MAFRLRVKEILEERNIPVGRMSREANVPITMARKMVKDPNYIPSIPTLDKVAKYLGVSIEELYTNDDEAGEPRGQ
ncbi:MAG TPA: helix-turn-helix transcriptional regulator [Ktedonobacteraceae bacterium]|nr:helix-turn-helix transcriptional regulator [Ktedonobacteraceae bacterium]